MIGFFEQLASHSKFLIIIMIIGFSVLLFYPFLEPEFTIQCVSEPCLVPNESIFDRIIQHINQ